MPTFRHGRNTAFKVDDSGGTLRDISSQCRGVTLSRPVDTADTTAYLTFDKTSVVGFRSGTFSVEGMFSAGVSTEVDPVFSGILGQEASVTFEYGPEGTTTGRVRYTGEAYLTSYELSSPVGDMVGFSAEFLITGAVTRNTWP